MIRKPLTHSLYSNSRRTCCSGDSRPIPRSFSRGKEDGRKWHGFPENAEYGFIPRIRDHAFAVAPFLARHSEVAHNTIDPLFHGGKPQSVSQIENARRTFNNASQQERQRLSTALQMVRLEILSQQFQDPKWNLDYHGIEKMFFPNYLPTHSEVRHCFSLPRRHWYTPEPFSTLEVISRFPLERMHGGDPAKPPSTPLTFPEWYALYRNYHHSFHPLRYLCEATQQSLLYTQEFIHALAAYLSQRVAAISPPRPILLVNAMNGRLACLLNRTNQIPVPVLPCHEEPTKPNYLLHIPAGLQRAFDLEIDVETLTVREGLAKYRPGVVLCQDMPPERDYTREFRQEGCVREYLLLGISNSYTSGSMWYTWGNLTHRPEDDRSREPHHRQAGFEMTHLPWVSRWVYERNDGEIATGFGHVVSFCKRDSAPGWRERLAWRCARLRPFY